MKHRWWLVVPFVLIVFMPWLESPIRELNLVDIAFLASSQEATTVIIAWLLIVAIAVSSVCFLRYSRLVPVTVWVVLGLILVFYVDVACNGRSGILQEIVDDYHQAGRIFGYYNAVSPDRLNPLDEYYLVSQIKVASSGLRGGLLHDAFALTMKAVGIGFWFALFYASVLSVVLVVEVRRPIGLTAVSLITLACGIITFPPVVASIYYYSAKVVFESRDALTALHFLEKARSWDPLLEKVPEYNYFVGEVELWVGQQGSYHHHLLRAHKHIQRGKLSQAMVEYNIAIAEGAVVDIPERIMPDALLAQGVVDLRSGSFFRGGALWNKMALIPGAEDAFMYRATTHLRMGGRVAGQLSLQDNETALSYFSQDLVVADILVSMGCGYDRLGDSQKTRDMFMMSKDKFALAKVINFRSQKGLIGL